MQLSELIQWLYYHEINASIDWFWDAGYRFRIGDKQNGYISEFETTNLNNGIDWLKEQAHQLLPHIKQWK